MLHLSPTEFWTLSLPEWRLLEAACAPPEPFRQSDLDRLRRSLEKDMS